MLVTVDFVLLLLVLADFTVSLVPNMTMVDDLKNNLKGVETRRKRKKHRSTSSSEGNIGKGSDTESDKESLNLSTMESSSSTSESKDKPKSTEERRGWRKWHRKCPPCPEDMVKKWRDPSIQWICGAYQRARRSFKSLCMMHYRNCQDGTMFVKIHDQKCANNTRRDQPYGIHFFYDYKVVLNSDSTEDSDSEDSVSDDSSDI